MTTIYERNELYENFTNPILTITLNSYEPQDFETYVTQDKNIEIIKKYIPLIVYNKDYVINDKCPIHLCDFVGGETYIRYFPNCSHGIHDESFSKFIKYFSNCPLCKTPLIY